MNRINLLPKWVLPDTIPSVYDCTSGSWVEMASKLYGAMRELQTDYNSFVEELNKTINEYMESTTEDQEEFKCQITKIMNNYIMMIDEKIKIQDAVISDAVDYMTDNIINTTNEIITESIENGKIQVSHIYDETNEELTLIISGGEA